MCIWVGRGDPIGRDSEVFFVLSMQSRANWGGGGWGIEGGCLLSKSSSGGGFERGGESF